MIHQGNLMSDIDSMLISLSSQIGLDVSLNTLYIAAILAGLFVIVTGLIYLVSMWLIYEKAGQPGWANLIPIYGTIVFLRVAGKPGWWFFLLLIPVVNVIVMLVAVVGLGQWFGKGAFFILGLILFNWIFVVWLAFDGSVHQDPNQQPDPAWGYPPTTGSMQPVR